MSECFRTIGLGVDPELLCPYNAWAESVARYTRDKGKIVDYIGNLPSCSEVVALRDIGRTGEKSPRLDLEMAKSTLRELAQLGLRLPADYYFKRTRTLCAVNMMPGLVYCSVLSRDKSRRTSFFVTKNADVVRLLSARYGLEFPDKAVRKYSDRLAISEAEIRNDVLKCVKVTFAKGRIKLTAADVYVNSKSTTILPMHDVGFYADSVANRLGSGVSVVKLRCGNEFYELVTSLDPEVFARRTELCPSYAKEFIYSPVDMGVLRLYDFKRKGFVSVNALDIVSIARKA